MVICFCVRFSASKTLRLHDELGNPIDLHMNVTQLEVDGDADRDMVSPTKVYIFNKTSHQFQMFPFWIFFRTKIERNTYCMPASDILFSP